MTLYSKNNEAVLCESTLKCHIQPLLLLLLYIYFIIKRTIAVKSVYCRGDNKRIYSARRHNVSLLDNHQKRINREEAEHTRQHLQQLTTARLYFTKERESSYELLILLFFGFHKR